MTDITYMVVPDDDNFDPQYVPETDDAGALDGHYDIPEDLGDVE